MYCKLYLVGTYASERKYEGSIVEVSLTTRKQKLTHTGRRRTAPSSTKRRLDIDFLQAFQSNRPI